jgi:hypothetical protein
LRLELEEGENIASISHLDLVDLHFQTTEIPDKERHKLLKYAQDIIESEE